jgi:hypothetical protein
MRKYTIFLFILFAFSVSLTGQSKRENKCDYITSGYYQLVYEADIAKLEGNDSLAIVKLQEAEKRCPLINQFQYREIELYCRLLMKNRQFDKAISYLDTLAVSYGISPFFVLIDLQKDSVLTQYLLANNPNFYDTALSEFWTKSESFYTSEKDSLVKVLNAISEADQEVRKENNPPTFDRKKMRQTDSINQIKLLKIIEKYGFPNLRLFGNKDPELDAKIGAMCVHFWENKEFGEMLLRFVREGKCEPIWYGFFVDKKMLEKHKKVIFAFLKNTKDDQIKDIKNLNKRRVSIGMPTREMERKRSELIRYNAP